MISVRRIVPCGAVILVVSTIGATYPGLEIIPAAILSVALVALSAREPKSAVFLGMIIPIVDTEINRTLPEYLGLLLLVVGISKAWPSASRQARTGALTIAALGSCSLFTGIGFGALTPENQSVAFSVAYAALMGVCAVVARPSPGQIAAGLMVLGIYASFLAVSSPSLSTDRGTVILGENANGVGFITSLGLVASLVLIRRSSRLISLVAIASAAACGFGIVATESRGALLAAVAAVYAMIMHRRIRGRRMNAVITAAASLALMAVVAGPISEYFVEFVGRQENIADASTEVRQELLLYAVKAGLSNPLTGIGLGQLANYSQVDPLSGLGYRAHNVFAGVLAETGVITFLLLCAVVVLALRNSRVSGSRDALPFAIAVVVNGLSLEWWGSNRTGPIALAVLGVAIGLRTQLQETERRLDAVSQPATNSP